MSKRDARLYLEDIRTAIEKIEAYTKGLSFKEFAKNLLVIDAVVRNFGIIGEAANNIPAEIKEKYAAVPWGEAMGMRNKVVHEYWGIDEETLWKTIREDLPALKKHIEAIERESK